ncbi:MAG TPA: hypothetical protein VLG40_00460 [Candidatus Saccharimonas sp.]|nr:hypothetical protein [Candidatus Saccharimonas sp.]
MNIDLRKPSHVIFFAALLPVVSYAIGWAFVQLFPNLPFWVEGISPLTAYGLLFSFFDNIAWHWPIFRWLGVTGVPDVRGRWLGEQVSSYTNEAGKHITSRVIMEVVQTFSHIHVTVYYQRWTSKISVAQFVEIDGTPTLLVMFDAAPKMTYDNGNIDAHKGVTKLVMTPQGKLEGTYFNGEGRHGELSYRRTRFTLAHTFDPVKKV